MKCLGTLVFKDVVELSAFASLDIVAHLFSLSVLSVENIFPLIICYNIRVKTTIRSMRNSSAQIFS